MKRRGKNGAREGYVGPERRNISNDHVQRGEFSEFACDVRRTLKGQDVTLRRLDTAMFAKDSDNDNGVNGVMVIMQRIDQHIDVARAWAKTIKRAIKWVGVVATTVGAVAGAAYYGRAAGWW